MSQLASFTYLNASDVPYLGFWSKPKPRLFRKPVSEYENLLGKHTLRDYTFGDADGTYVWFVLEWIELHDKKFNRCVDPVIATLMKHIGGSHWIIKHDDARLAALLECPPNDNEWMAFVNKIKKIAGVDLEREFFEAARLQVHERLSEIKPSEALLISLG